MARLSLPTRLPLPSEPLARGEWIRGIGLTLLGGAALFGYAQVAGESGYVAVFAVPFSVGAVLGWSTPVWRAAHIVVSVFTLLTLVGSVVIAIAAGAVGAGLGGLFCGATASVVALLPTLLGAFVGAQLRARFGRRLGAGARTAAALAILFAAGGVLYLETFRTPRHDVTRVVTTRVLEMSPDEAWRRLLFYEDVGMDPPLLARIGLPAPIGTRGSITRVGELVTCVYDEGRLVKRITAVEPGRRLAFDVVEQVGIEERAVELRDGSFEFAALPGGRTRVTLTTRYRPLLEARRVWRPFEYVVTRSLHHHVLDGMVRVVPAPRLARAE